MMVALAFALAVMGRTEVTASECLRADATLQAGAIARSQDFSVTACPKTGAGAAFRHDAPLGISRLSRPLAAGDVVRPFPEYGVTMVRPGEKLRILVSVGAARIEREVVALQAARPGERLFVRSGDGQVLSARYEVAP
jgi:hypothetical protein